MDWLDQQAQVVAHRAHRDHKDQAVDHRDHKVNLVLQV